MLRLRRELDFRDELPQDLLESFNPSLTTVVMFFLGIFCGKIDMVKGCCGFACEIGVGMMVCGSMFVGLLIGFSCGW